MDLIKPKSFQQRIRMKELKILNQIFSMVDRASRMKVRQADQHRKDRQLEIAEERLQLQRDRQQNN
jgi:hypothetical protein